MIYSNNLLPFSLLEKEPNYFSNVSIFCKTNNAKNKKKHNSKTKYKKIRAQWIKRKNRYMMQYVNWKKPQVENLHLNQMIFKDLEGKEQMASFPQDQTTSIFDRTIEKKSSSVPAITLAFSMAILASSTYEAHSIDSHQGAIFNQNITYVANEIYLPFGFIHDDLFEEENNMHRENHANIHNLGSFVSAESHPWKPTCFASCDYIEEEDIEIENFRTSYNIIKENFVDINSQYWQPIYFESADRDEEDDQ